MMLTLGSIYWQVPVQIDVPMRPHLAFLAHVAFFVIQDFPYPQLILWFQVQLLAASKSDCV